MQPATGFHKPPLKGLYAITPTNLEGQALIEAVEACLAGGIALLQYRAKPAPDADTARAILQRCQNAHIGLIINDDVELAARIGARGVHLGADDGDVLAVRRRLGMGPVIGVSCYNEPARAYHAVEQGASYLAFGSVFTSPTKPEAVRCPLPVITAARKFGLPVVAIGGITVENAAPVIEAGADLLAVVSDLFEAPNITDRAREYAALFNSSNSRSELQ